MVLPQLLEAPYGMPVDEELQHLLEEPCRRNLVKEMGERVDGLVGPLGDGHSELRGKAHGAEHPHRILVVAGVRIADDVDAPLAHVAETVVEVPERSVLR